MTTISEIIQYCSELLSPELFKDHCPNGLQIAGQSTIKTIVSGVSANQALIDQAIAKHADLLLVHHGFFWAGEDPCLVGIKRERIASLLQQHINLMAYHLPLDAHPKFGNNAILAEKLNLKITDRFNVNGAPGLGYVGKLKQPMSAQLFSEFIAQQLLRAPLYVGNNPDAEIKTIAWCTGAAQEVIQQAINLNVDAYLTGEISERTVAIAREADIHFFAAGHHATERYGVAEFGKHLAHKFKLAHEFIDIDNPV